MLDHSDIWQAIDRLAQMQGLSPSGLARRAGLDPTTFNRSKRVTTGGRLRWPSTESIAKVLEATDTTFSAFAGLIGQPEAPAARLHLPVIGWGLARDGGGLDPAGRPAGAGWDDLAFPQLDDPDAYALEIEDDSMAPMFADGDIVIVSPRSTPRKGDRIIVRTTAGALRVGSCLRRTATRLTLGPPDPLRPAELLPVADLAWIARIVWASL